MVIDKKLNIAISKLHKNEKQKLLSYIEKEFSVSGEDIAKKQNIKEKLDIIIHLEFDVFLEDNDTLRAHLSIMTLAELIEEEFDLEEIKVADAMQWITLEDTVNYIVGATDEA